MWYAPSIVTPALDEPVTVEMARKHCGLSDLSRDDELNIFVTAERQRIERYCGVVIQRQTVDVRCDAFADFARVRIAPVASIASVSYVDAAGASQTVDAGNYDLVSHGLESSITIKAGYAWPAIKPGTKITVRMVVGFDPVERPLMLAILMRVGQHVAKSAGNGALKKIVVDGVGSREYDVSGDAAAATEAAVSALLEPYRNWALQ